jgi:hypothetical protein
VGASAEAFGPWLETVEQQDPEGKIVVAVERYEGALVEIDSLPGAGEALGPRLWVACASEGNDPNAATMQLRSRIAPVQKQGGNSKVVCFRWARPWFLHQTWTEFAHHSIKTCFWACAYYQARKAKGHGDGAILRALAFKSIRIVARLWKDQALYDESFYLAHCSARLAAA